MRRARRSLDQRGGDVTADPVRERLAEITARADAATWDEEWRPIPDVPNYDVSNFGHVRSHLRRGNHKDKVANRPRRQIGRAHV